MEARYNARGERLRVDGFRIFRLDDEEYLFYRAGSKLLEEVMIASFDYSYLEAKYAKVNIHSQAFIDLCEMNRTLAVKTIADMIEEADKKNGNNCSEINFNPQAENEMLEQIRAKYQMQRRTEAHRTKKDGPRNRAS